MALRVRAMREEDLPRVYEINRLSFTTDAWSMDAFRREFNLPYSHRFVLENEGELIGYAVLWVIKEEAFVMTFAITPEFRNRGAGKWFLKELLKELKGEVRSVQLDVRKSNLPAIKLYRSAGFKVVRERPKFYSDGETALVMEVELTPGLV
ncbi:ribosomal protein S18-alanine N-acetyltransferase [Hydrogenivirga sp. 128-5-R1-1]|uniref:ribosomal protein S18-alanine N-acetyltransferase n=1 Tax=Hydrogenivirga sp. 128-5-R1-1 TaxID=392423 RepID=UPI00015F0C63|nr:ribosomal protein S18-alanine N-acetyltransferase [Hydrogenivirga sp. 128-5-R1-1]EDP75881.1 ribosomal-protein-alanine acetyltransferase [Hydrogenivirga sp. 128-5-R1-1]